VRNDSVLGVFSEQTWPLTIDEFVYENKIVLDALLVHFPKIGAGDGVETIEVFEHEGGVGVCPARQVILEV
jgi:hypothetical protein